MLFYGKDLRENSEFKNSDFEDSQENNTWCWTIFNTQYTVLKNTNDTWFEQSHSCISLFFRAQWQWKVLKDPKQWNLSLENVWVIWGQSGKHMKREGALLSLGIGSKHIQSHRQGLLSVLEAEQVQTASVNGSCLARAQIRTCSYACWIKTCVRLWRECLWCHINKM